MCARVRLVELYVRNSWKFLSEQSQRRINRRKEEAVWRPSISFSLMASYVTSNFTTTNRSAIVSMIVEIFILFDDMLRTSGHLKSFIFPARDSITEWSSPKFAGIIVNVTYRYYDLSSASPLTSHLSLLLVPHSRVLFYNDVLAKRLSSFSRFLSLSFFNFLVRFIY